MAEGPREGPPAPLPAPYTSPWRLLGRDLRALLASGRLKLQELWRLNGSGALPQPGFWPRRLAPWFWPLVLLLIAAVVWAAWVGLGPSRPSANPPPAAPEQAQSLPSPAGRPAPGGAAHPEPPAAGRRATAPAVRGSQPMAPPPTTEARPGAAMPEAMAAPEAMTPPQTKAPPQATPTAEEPASPPPLEASDSPAPAPDPLREALAPVDPRHWIEAASTEPSGLGLQLRLSSAYGLASLEQRRTWAERCWRQVQDLGYERLELVDGSGQLLGRQALVGSGMILLDPS